MQSMQKLVFVFALSIFPSLFLFQACTPFTKKFSFTAQIFLIGEDPPSSFDEGEHFVLHLISLSFVLLPSSGVS